MKLADTALKMGLKKDFYKDQITSIHSTSNSLRKVLKSVEPETYFSPLNRSPVNQATTKFQDQALNEVNLESINELLKDASLQNLNLSMSIEALKGTLKNVERANA